MEEERWTMNMIGEKCQTKKIEIFRMLAVVVVACLLRLYASRYSHMFDSSLVNVFECALGHIFNLLCVMEQSKNIYTKSTGRICNMQNDIVTNAWKSLIVSCQRSNLDFKSCCQRCFVLSFSCLCSLRSKFQYCLLVEYILVYSKIRCAR